MKNKDSLFFRLLRLGLGTETMDNGQLTIDNVSLNSATRSFDFAQDDNLRMTNSAQDDKAEVNYPLSIAQGVGAFIFDGLQKAAEAGVLPADAVSREMKMKLFSHTMQVEKLCKEQYSKAVELADIYAEHGIRTVVLKGIAAGQCYPNPWHRPCGDLDCFLMGNYEKGNIIAENSGVKVERDFYKHSHIDYKGLVVENHQFCTAVRGSKQAKAFERLLQSLLSEEGTTMIGDTKLECPSPMFNALFLAHHALNHFLSEGIALRHLSDWAMLIHKQGEEIDWVKFKYYSEEFGLNYFAEAMTRLANKFLGVPIPASYIINEDDVRDDYLLNEMISGISNAPSSDSIWKHRLSILNRAFNNSERYRMFSDVSYLQNIGRLLYGFLFERKPRI